MSRSHNDAENALIRSIDIIFTEAGIMANLLMRGLDQRLLQALKEQAARRGHSAEAEHRAILERALLRPERKSFAQILAAMPNVGLDEDFERTSEGPSNRWRYGVSAGRAT